MSTNHMNRLGGDAPGTDSDLTHDELIRITIDLGNGNQENVIVQKGEEHQSNELARRFCQKHGYDDSIREALALQIQENIDAVLEERKEGDKQQEMSRQRMIDENQFQDPLGASGTPGGRVSDDNFAMHSAKGGPSQASDDAMHNGGGASAGGPGPRSGHPALGLNLNQNSTSQSQEVSNRNFSDANKGQAPNQRPYNRSTPNTNQFQSAQSQNNMQNLSIKNGIHKMQSFQNRQQRSSSFKSFENDNGNQGEADLLGMMTDSKPQPFDHSDQKERDANTGVAGNSSEQTGIRNLEIAQNPANHLAQSDQNSNLLQSLNQPTVPPEQYPQNYQAIAQGQHYPPSPPYENQYQNQQQMIMPQYAYTVPQNELMASGGQIQPGPQMQNVFGGIGGQNQFAYPQGQDLMNSYNYAQPNVNFHEGQPSASLTSDQYYNLQRSHKVQNLLPQNSWGVPNTNTANGLGNANEMTQNQKFPNNTYLNLLKQNQMQAASKNKVQQKNSESAGRPGPGDLRSQPAGPAMRTKPQISALSQQLAACTNKRGTKPGEKIHERLFRQPILAKQLAKQKEEEDELRHQKQERKRLRLLQLLQQDRGEQQPNGDQRTNSIQQNPPDQHLQTASGRLGPDPANNSYTIDHGGQQIFGQTLGVHHQKSQSMYPQQPFNTVAYYPDDQSPQGFQMANNSAIGNMTPGGQLPQKSGEQSRSGGIPGSRNQSQRLQDSSQADDIQTEVPLNPFHGNSAAPLRPQPPRSEGPMGQLDKEISTHSYRTIDVNNNGRNLDGASKGSRPPDHSRSAGRYKGYVSIGEKLYQKGLQKNEERMRFILDQRQKQEAKEMEALTFQPKLVTQSYFRSSQNLENDHDYVSKVIIRGGEPVQAQVPTDSRAQRGRSPTFAHDAGAVAQQQRGHRRSKSSHNLSRPTASQDNGRALLVSSSPQHLRLLQYGEDLQLRKAQAKQLADLTELHKFDFKPKILRKSRSIVQQKKAKLIQMQEQMEFVHQMQLDGGGGYAGADKSPHMIPNGDSDLEMARVRSRSGSKSRSRSPIPPVSPSAAMGRQHLQRSKLNRSTSPEARRTITPARDRSTPPQRSQENASKASDDNSRNKPQQQQPLFLQNGWSLLNKNHYHALYSDAQHRQLRQEHIYSKCIDRECTFKPERITMKSKTSKNTIREVQQEVRERLTNKDLRNQLQQHLQNQLPQFENGTLDISAIEVASQIHSNKDDKSMELLANPNLQNLLTDQKQQTLSPRSTANKSRLMYLNKAKQADEKVFERLAKQAQLQNQLQAQRSQKPPEDRPFDPVTGQELFKPKINKNKNAERLVGRRNQPHQVGQSLYNTHTVYTNKRKQREQEEIDHLNQQRKLISKANDKSDRIIQQARKGKLGEIFDRLDDDQDGCISSSKIGVNVLSSELYNAFRPLLNELDQLGQSLDKEEFVDASSRLYDTLSQKEKNLILKFEKPSQVVDPVLENCTFAPKTNYTTIQARISSGRPKSAQYKSSRPASTRPGSNRFNNRESVILQGNHSSNDINQANLQITNSSFGGSANKPIVIGGTHSKKSAEFGENEAAAKLSISQRMNNAGAALPPFHPTNQVSSQYSFRDELNQEARKQSDHYQQKNLGMPQVVNVIDAQRISPNLINLHAIGPAQTPQGQLQQSLSNPSQANQQQWRDQVDFQNPYAQPHRIEPEPPVAGTPASFAGSQPNQPYEAIGNHPQLPPAPAQPRSQAPQAQQELTMLQSQALADQSSAAMPQQHMQQEGSDGPIPQQYMQRDDPRQTAQR